MIVLLTKWARQADPRLADVTHRFCNGCEDEHKTNRRTYSHSLHIPGAVCWCQAAMDLEPNSLTGICLHEYGHLLAGNRKNEEEAEAAADVLLLDRFDIKMQYRGRYLLQWVDLGKIIKGFGL